MRACSPNQARRPARVRHQPGAPRAAGVARPAALPENRGAAALPKWIASPGAPWIAVLLAAYGALRFRFVFGLPFLNDDYTILDKVGRASFASLWTAEHPLWGWYRPWSRELHFWTLSRLFGPSELPFHAASLVLWLSVLTVYFALVRRILGAPAATIAAAGAATLTAWGGVLSWAAGVQELWMLLFALLFLHAAARRDAARSRPAAPAAGPGASRLAPALFALGWATLGALPLFMPSVGWLSYYALLSALGAWAALAAGLARRPALAIFAVTIVAALQPAHAATPSYEWGSDYFQRRAAFFVGRLKQGLRLGHPEFPSHSRLSFVGVPNGT